MIVIDNPSGLGNKLKNVVSELRRGTYIGDQIRPLFEHSHLFTFTQPSDTAKKENIFSQTWKLVLDPPIENPLRVDKKFIVIGDEHTHWIWRSEIDCQYDNISDHARHEFLKFWNMIRFSDDIINGTAQFTLSHNVQEMTGVHIRSWTDDPARYRLLHKTSYFVDQMRKFDGDFFVCSDSPQVIDELQNEFGQRILTRPFAQNRHISFNKNEAAGINGMIDMLILAQCKRIIGTYQSTFTECAWWLGGAQQEAIIPVPDIVRTFGP